MSNIVKSNPGGHDEFSYEVNFIKATSGDVIPGSNFTAAYDIWESLFAKALAIKLIAFDYGGAFTKVALQPGDQIQINLYKSLDGAKVNHVFDIMSIGDGSRTPDTQGRTYIINGISPSASQNKITSVSKAKSGTISSMIESISKERLKIDPKNITVEESDGDKKSIVFPSDSPYNTIDWLCDHAISKKGGPDNSMYFFYETADQFWCKTLGEIIKDANTYNYTMPTDRNRDKNEADYLRLISYKQNKLGHLGDTLDGGMFQNELMELDIIGAAITSKKFDFVKEGKKLILLNGQPPVDMDNNLEPYRQPDVKYKGAINNLKVRTSEEGYDDYNSYGKKHNALLAQKRLFNQIGYTFMFLGNPMLRAGDLIKLIALEPTKTSSPEVDKLLGNKFLIGNIRHHVSDPRNYVTVVDVFADGHETARTPAT
jgi:hypothetical protein